MSELECLVGPWLLRRGGPLLTQHLEQELRRCELEAAGLARGQRASEPGWGAALIRRRELFTQALAKTRRQGHPGPA